MDIAVSQLSAVAQTFARGIGANFVSKYPIVSKPTLTFRSCVPWITEYYGYEQLRAFNLATLLFKYYQIMSNLMLN